MNEGRIVYSFRLDGTKKWPRKVCMYGRKCVNEKCTFVHSSLRTKKTIRYSTYCTNGSIETCPVENCEFAHCHRDRYEWIKANKRCLEETPEDDSPSPVKKLRPESEEQQMLSMYSDLKDKHIAYIRSIRFTKSNGEPGEIPSLDIDKLRDVYSIMLESHANLVKAMSFIDN